MKGKQMSKKYIQFRLNKEQEEMKQYLIDNGINLSVKFRDFLIQLYEFEKEKELVVNITS